MALEQYVAFALAMIVFVVTPGPAILAVIARALADGFTATIPHIVGLVVGNLCYLLASIYGLAWIALQMGGAFVFIKLLGGAYLVYLGVKMWRSSGEITALEMRQPKNLISTFLTGLMVTLSNPKAILFYLAILPAVINIQTIDFASLVPVMMINSLVLIMVIGCYSAIAAKARRLFTNARSMRKLNKGAGGVMIGAGLGIAAS